MTSSNTFPAPDLFSVVTFQLSWLNGYFQPKRSPSPLETLGIALLREAFIRNQNPATETGHTATLYGKLGTC